ncbi:MAG: glycosyltransferase family 1 protein [Deltaproteobacteria bacterium]|nr:glycosyltransferase family 1 protein [Deltaproteobacteria bacterium]
MMHGNADYGSAFSRSDKPSVVTVLHNVFEDNYQRYTTLSQKAFHFGWLKRRIAQALRDADRVVAISHSTKASIERTFGARNIEVIYNGIDSEIFKPLETGANNEFPGKIRLLFVGNLTKRKGADLLPAIMKKLGDDYVLVHPSGLRTGADFGAVNIVKRTAPSTQELVELYNGCDIFLFPSRLEGFGYAVGEAMACGKPVICTDASSLPELVVDQQGGFLCGLDDVDAFVERIRFLGARAALRQTMGAFNCQRIEKNFTVAQMGRAYAELYRNLLTAKPRR